MKIAEDAIEKIVAARLWLPHLQVLESTGAERTETELAHGLEGRIIESLSIGEELEDGPRLLSDLGPVRISPGEAAQPLEHELLLLPSPFDRGQGGKRKAEDRQDGLDRFVHPRRWDAGLVAASSADAVMLGHGAAF
jgi:hypothetical protein